MRNKFAGSCRDCGTHVAEGAGYFHKQPRGMRPKWTVRCVPCVALAKEARGADLSYVQREALLVLRTTERPALPREDQKDSLP